MLLGIHKQLKKILSKENTDKLPTAYRNLLNEFYLADIEKLEKLLSINLTNWKQS